VLQKAEQQTYAGAYLDESSADIESLDHRIMKLLVLPLD
jgi:hypothetical protein